MSIVSSIMGIISPPPKKKHDSLTLLILHAGLHILMQKAVILLLVLDACRKLRKFLAE